MFLVRLKLKIYRIAREESYTPEISREIGHLSGILQRKYYDSPEEREKIISRIRQLMSEKMKMIHKIKYEEMLDEIERGSIPKDKFTPIASGNTIYKTSVADGEFRDLKSRVDKIKDDIRDLKKDSKDNESKLKKIEKDIENLNVGSRMFSQSKTIFTSLERKIERMDAVIQEWHNYKKEMDDNIKRQVEKHTKARISDITPQAY